MYPPQPSADEPLSAAAPLSADLARAIVSQIVSLENIERLAKGNENALIAAGKILFGILLGGAGSIAALLADVIVGAEEVSDPAFQRLMQTAFRDITGVEIGSGSVAPGGRASRTQAAQSLGAALLTAIAGSTGSEGASATLEPSQTPAENYVTWVTQMALEGWLTGTIGEFFTLGQVEALGDLDDALANTLGLGRMTRRVMGPLLNAKVITPFQWHVNRIYRPNLLSTAEVVRQVARGRWSREQGDEELARQGWSNDRIEALLNAAAKFHSVGDLELLERAGAIGHADAVQHLRDQGYDATIAETELRLERIKRIAAFERSMAGGAVDAFARGAIDRSLLNDYVDGVTIDPQERAQYLELADARRVFRQKQLSPAEARACVKAGVLAMPDYRRALREDGYTEEATLALELLLRHELEEQAEIAALREAAAAERAAEQAAREAERAARAAAVIARKLERPQADESDLEQAAVRGLIPLSHVEQYYATHYEAGSVPVLVALLEERRADYVEQQERAAEARQRAARRDIDVGALEQSVLEGVLTIDEFRSRLTTLRFSPADADLLTRTLAAQIAARQAAARTKADAEAAARRRGIDLPRFESLVRRGVRTSAQYTALLQQLGFTDAARADLVELLQLQIADDAQARAARAEAARQLAERGLNLEEWRRAVVLQLQTRDAFAQFLTAQRIAADRQRLLLAELDQALADAEAARRRREEQAAAVDTRALSLDRLRAAARLSLITIPTYEARLRTLAYTDTDIAIERELLLLEIADVQAARQAREAAARPADPRELSLAELARAVRRGLRPIADFRARAVDLHFSADAVETQVRLLELELAEATAARARRDALVPDAQQRDLTLGALEEAVKKERITLDEYHQRLRALGFTVDDAELLTMLLVDELEE